MSVMLDNEIDSKVKSELKTKHEQIPAYYFFYDQYIDIDRGIVELMCHIWRAGIRTSNSCENNVPTDYVWIQFRDTKDLKKFINITFRDIERTSGIYDRSLSEDYDPKNCDRWVYNYDLRDVVQDIEDFDIVKNDHDALNLYCFASVRFPKYDYSYILEQFKKHNDKYDYTNDIIDSSQTNK